MATSKTGKSKNTKKTAASRAKLSRAAKPKSAPKAKAKHAQSRKVAKAPAKKASAKQAPAKRRPVRKAPAKKSKASARTKAPKQAKLKVVANSPAKPPQIGRDWSKTLFLPSTDFPMKAGLPQREPELLARWRKLGLYDRLREEAMGRPKFILHDGPPYANGPLHIGHALNKILKDVINRSQAMMGKDANYVPGWDCHGLPIEWKIEEENYRAKGRQKPDLSDPQALIAFRRECRAYAQHWLEVQREEFERLGVEGDWDHPYTTMSHDAEATIAAELMKFAMNGHALSRLEAGDVVGGGEDRARRSGGRIPGDHVPHDLREVSDRTAGRTVERRPRRRWLDREAERQGDRRLQGKDRGSRRREHRHLDDDAVDHPRQPRHRLLAGHRLRALRGHRRARRQLGQTRRQVRPCGRAG